jgi:hypothetical protein
MLIIKPIMVIMSWTCNSISFKHMSLVSIIGAHLITYHSNVGVWLENQPTKGLCTLFYKGSTNIFQVFAQGVLSKIIILIYTPTSRTIWSTQLEWDN